MRHRSPNPPDQQRATELIEAQYAEVLAATAEQGFYIFRRAASDASN